MHHALCVFVKTPGRSALKTRLRRDLGAITDDFYLTCLKTIYRRLNEFRDVYQTKHPSSQLTIYWAVAEALGLNHSLWSGWPTLYQGEGDLGRRLETIYASALDRHDSAFLLGADLPHIEFAALTKSIEALEAGYDGALGATADGGFYLFAGQREIPSSVWHGTPYSQSTTHTIFAGHLKTLDWKMQALSTNFDIDLYEDYLHLRDWLTTQGRTHEFPELISHFTKNLASL